MAEPHPLCCDCDVCINGAGGLVLAGVGRVTRKPRRTRPDYVAAGATTPLGAAEAAREAARQERRRLTERQRRQAKRERSAA